MNAIQLSQLLKQYYGYDKFRPLQLEIINDLIEGNDIVALLPTGGGKSLCYQLPMLFLKSRCIVISPLIALMDDQVDSLLKKNIKAMVIHSGKSNTQNQITLSEFKNSKSCILYVSPERFNSDKFLSSLKDVNISHIAIDEAHCISQWGYDFRPSYLQLHKVKRIFPIVPIIALTATATPEVEQDIISKLRLTNWKVFKSSFARENLLFNVKEQANPMQRLVKLLVKYDVTSIVYLRSRRGVKQISDNLNNRGLKADYYHGGLDHNIRETAAMNWLDNKTKSIVATNAFGMGIDKSDVRMVIHMDLPGSLEEYYQEAGRAGRDGAESLASIIISSDVKDKVLEDLDKFHLDQKQFLKLVKWLEQYSTNQKHRINLNESARSSGIPILKILNGLKFLVKSGSMAISEGIENPSRIRFYYDNQHPVVFRKLPGFQYRLADFLLKNYEDLYDYDVVVIEEVLSEVLDISIIKVVSGLRELEEEGYLSYYERDDYPWILMHEGWENTYEYQNLLIIQEKSKANLLKMIEYINTTECRQRFLTQYFGEKNHSDCGKCDNCKKVDYSGQEVRVFKDRLFKLLDSNPLDVTQVFDLNADIDKELIVSTIKLLEDERELRIVDGMLMKVN